MYPPSLDRVWNQAHRIDKVGSCEFRLSPDGELFFKHDPERPGLIQAEYDALVSLGGSTGVSDLSTLVPVALLNGTTLVTYYCEGATLSELLDPTVHRSFGTKLRALHNAGHTHGHVTCDDVLVTDSGFVLTDLALWDRLPEERDVALMRLNCQTRRMRSFWKGRDNQRCWRSFSEGYGVQWSRRHQEELEMLVSRRMRSRLTSLKPSGVAMALCWRFLTGTPERLSPDPAAEAF